MWPPDPNIETELNITTQGVFNVNVISSLNLNNKSNSIFKTSFISSKFEKSVTAQKMNFI